MSKYSEQDRFIVWDHKTPLWSDRFEKAFDDLNAIYEYCDDSYNLDADVKEEWDSCSSSPTLMCEFLRLYCMEAMCFPELKLPEWVYDNLPESIDSLYDVIPQDSEIFKRINALNKYISEQRHVLWYEPTNWKPIPESLIDPDYKMHMPKQPRRRECYGTSNTTTS